MTFTHFLLGASLVAHTVKNLPSVWETQVRSLGWEDPLEKEMATYSRIIAWKIPWKEDYTPWGRKESDMNERLHFTGMQHTRVYPVASLV